MARIGRPPTCECGNCAKCKSSEASRRWYQRMTSEQRRAYIAKRDPEKTRAADRARYYRNREARMARAKVWAKENPELTQAYGAAWARRNPEKYRAHSAVSNAIRDGRLERQACEVCGGRAQAHHDDYSKPLEVRWLCSTHHAEVHRRYEVAA